MHIKYSVLLSSVNLTSSMSVRSMKHSSLGYFINGWVWAHNYKFSNKNPLFAHIANFIKNIILLLIYRSQGSSMKIYVMVSDNWSERQIVC